MISYIMLFLYVKVVIQPKFWS